MAVRSAKNEEMLALALLHRIGLERVSYRLVRKVLAQIRRVEADVLARIASYSALQRKTAQLEVFLAELRRLYEDLYRPIANTLHGDLLDIAAYEVEFQTRTITATTGVVTNVPSLQQIVAAVETRPFQGKLLEGWLDDLPAGAARRVQEAIRQGFIEGQSTDAIIKRIRGTKAAKFNDGIMAISRRGAETMVRTAVAHMAATGQEATYAANADVLTGVMWVSVLDSRTTDICIGRDGKTYKVGEGPRPPAHLNCRSTTIGIVKGTTPPPRISYAEWLAKQSPERQAAILGKTRARLYREGKLPIDRFVSPDGTFWTLAELKQREAAAFAGMAGAV